MTRYVPPVFGSLFPQLSRVVSFLRQPIHRRRTLIALAAVLISLYSATVLVYVLVTPGIGLHYPFSPEIHRVFETFGLPNDLATPVEGDWVVRLGDEPISGWQHLMRHSGTLSETTARALAREEWRAPDWESVQRQDLTRGLAALSSQNPLSGLSLVAAGLDAQPWVVEVAGVTWIRVEIARP